MLLLLGSLQLVAQTPRKIWLDTDLLIGLPERAPREVDDGVALLMALKHTDKVDLVGISTVTDVNYGYEVAHKLMKWYAPHRNIPVYRGSDKCGDIGVENDATRALAAALRKEN
ncbi:MAG: nucleoside hydrolase [Spirosomataceae bacterium]